ncbi:MAG: L-threonylcarbamoyladenylate synthase [Nitrospirales bacterium]
MATVLSLTASPATQLIQDAEQCLQQGGVLAVPTDSFYALAVNPFHQAALERLVAMKGERNHKPFPVLIGEVTQINQFVPEVPALAWNLIPQFWPGLLTLVFSARADLPEVLTGGSGTVGIREPGDPRLRQLLSQIGPVTGTSANRAGTVPSTTAVEVQQQLGSEIDMILDGGPAPGGLPSTVLQLVGEIRLLREGAISLSTLQQALGPSVIITS